VLLGRVAADDEDDLLCSAMSRIEFVIAPLPKLVTRPVTVALCHNRAQWSMLLVASTCLVSLATRKFSSLCTWPT
jgi:hypothetical protein